jgi:hypothetical protein
LKAIPFRTFSGFLKQHVHMDLSALEQELFDLLFPAFQGTSDAEEAYERAKNNPLVSAASPLIQMMPGERRPRRFAGFDLPRSRYFALCADASGSDFQTLTHELRAYRDPVDLGMVEVLDLAQGCILSIRGATVPLEPQPALAVLIHEPQELPAKFHALAFQRVPGLKDNPIFIYRFPYRVIHCTIEKTIDLRFPEVQDWFYSTFRVLSDESNAHLAPGMGPDITPTTARSRFNLENGLAPVPDNFWSMLPTLMNPDLGGGNPGDTGATLVMIGHWMRQNRAGALVFPSARCDTAAVFQDGALKHWQGWNLLDYRESPLLGQPKAHMVTYVVSPWAWVSLPPGVRLHVAEKDSRLAGSFAVKNMVNYWAQDYLGQLNALKTARSVHGREKPRSQRITPSEGLAFRVFQIGALSMRWLRMAVQGSPADQIDSVVLELQGLALPYGMYSITGRVLELWPGVRQGETTVKEAVHSALIVSDLLSRLLQRCHPNEDLDKLARIGADLELLLFFLAGQARAGVEVKATSFDTSGFLAETGTALVTPWLDEAMKTEIRDFQKRALHEMKYGSSGTSSCLEEGVQLQKMIYDHLRRKGNNL